MRKKMTLEQMDHFLRHVEMHAEELRTNCFNKDKEYLRKLKEAQWLALEVSHDMIHVMRTKKFEGYEDADFDFDVRLPKNLKEHKFRHFNSASFAVGRKLKATLDLDIIDEKHIVLSKEDAEEQMAILSQAIQDAGVLLKLLEVHFAQA